MNMKDNLTGKIYHNVQMIKSGNERGDWVIFVADERKFPEGWNTDPFPVQRFEVVEVIK